MCTVGLCEPGTLRSTNSANTTPRIAIVIASLPYKSLPPPLVHDTRARGCPGSVFGSPCSWMQYWNYLLYQDQFYFGVDMVPKCSTNTGIQYYPGKRDHNTRKDHIKSTLPYAARSDTRWRWRCWCPAGVLRAPLVG